MSGGLGTAADRIAPPGDALGTACVTVTLADMSIRLEGLSGTLAEKISERYEGFLDAPAGEVFVVSTGAGRDCFVPPTEEGLLRIDEVERDGGAYFVSTDFSGFAHRDENRGYILLAKPEDSKFSVLAVENYLMRVFGNLALRAGGFFLHACGLVREGKAYVFYGPPGSGKSAVATLSPELGILSDDMVLVFRRGEAYFASSTPFWGAISRMMKEKGSYPIGGCFKLTKTTGTAVEKMNTIKAMTTLFSSSLFGSFSNYRSGILFDNIKNFVRTNDVRELQLPLQPVFWDMISK